MQVWIDAAGKPVPADVPARVPLAYGAAALFLLAGAALQWRRTAPLGALAASGLYLVFALLWAKRVLGFPQILGTWSGTAEQVALALGESEEAPSTDVFVVAGDEARERALSLVTQLRRGGVSADLDLAGRAAKGQMKQADRVGARYALILGDEGKATLRDMGSGSEREVDPGSVAAEIA